MFDELAERSLMSPLAGTKHTYVRLAIIIYCHFLHYIRCFLRYDRHQSFFQGGQYKTWTADYGLRTTNYGLGIKHGLGIKRGLSIMDWV